MAAIPASERQVDSPTAVLDAVREARAAADREEVRILELAREWAAMHEIDEPSSPLLFEQPARFTGKGVPEVGEFCVPELATVLHISTEAAGSLIAVRPGRREASSPGVLAPLAAPTVTTWFRMRTAEALVRATSPDSVVGTLDVTPTDTCRRSARRHVHLVPDP